MKNLSIQTDYDLVALYKQCQDQLIVGELYRRYTRFVFLVCMKYLRDADESKDAVMQIFEKLIQSLLEHEVSYFKAWLHTVARNHCLQILRKKQSITRKHSEIQKEQAGVVEFEPEMHLEEKHLEESRLQALTEAIEQLKPEQRECIRLFYLEEKSYNEVSELTGFDFKQVKSYIQNGKRNLSLMLTKSNFQLLVIIFMN